jgi:hypothetical protein
MKDFVINIGNIEKGIKKVFKESLYKCDELDRASINGVITALYLQKPLSLVVIPTECNKVMEDYNYDNFYTEYKSTIKYSDSKSNITDVIISQVTYVIKEGRRSIKSRFALSLISEGIIEPKQKGETV